MPGVKVSNNSKRARSGSISTNANSKTKQSRVDISSARKNGNRRESRGPSGKSDKKIRGGDA